MPKNKWWSFFGRLNFFTIGTFSAAFSLKIFVTCGVETALVRSPAHFNQLLPRVSWSKRGRRLRSHQVQHFLAETKKFARSCIAGRAAQKSRALLRHDPESWICLQVLEDHISPSFERRLKSLITSQHSCNFAFKHPSFLSFWCERESKTEHGNKAEIVGCSQECVIIGPARKWLFRCCCSYARLGLSFIMCCTAAM